MRIEIRGIPPLPEKHRQGTPDFPHATLDRAACAAFFRGKLHERHLTHELHGKSGGWGTRQVGCTAGHHTMRSRLPAREKCGLTWTIRALEFDQAELGSGETARNPAASC